MFFTFCEGAGCMLRDRCRRFLDGVSIDRSASGYVWVSGCEEESRPLYLPVPKVLTDK